MPKFNAMAQSVVIDVAMRTIIKHFDKTMLTVIYTYGYAEVFLTAQAATRTGVYLFVRVALIALV